MGKGRERTGEETRGGRGTAGGPRSTRGRTTAGVEDRLLLCALRRNFVDELLRVGAVRLRGSEAQNCLADPHPVVLYNRVEETIHVRVDVRVKVRREPGVEENDVWDLLESKDVRGSESNGEQDSDEM